MNPAKKAISIILAILCCVSGICYASATDTQTPETEIEQEEYVVIDNLNCSIVISGLSAKMTASITAQSSTSLRIAMELQKLKSGVYSTIETYTASKSGTSLQTEETRLINALSTYRLKVTFTAGSETVVRYAYP